MLFPDDIFTSFVAHPHLVDLARGHIYSRSHAKSLLGRVGVARVCDGQGSPADQVRRQSGVRMWWIVGVGSVGPGENVAEPPISHRLFVLRA